MIKKQDIEMAEFISKRKEAEKAEKRGALLAVSSKAIASLKNLQEMSRRRSVSASSDGRTSPAAGSSMYVP